MEALKQAATVATSSHKVGHAVAAASVATGGGSLLAALTGFFGLAAAGFGAVLSALLIYIHWNRWKLEKEKMRLENEAKQLDINERRGKGA